MKIKEGFVLRDIMGQAVAIPTGKASEVFGGMIKLNETGKDIWEQLAQNKSVDKIIDYIVETYDVERDRAEESVTRFIADMKEKGFIEE